MRGQGQLLRLTAAQKQAIADGRKTVHRIPAVYGTVTWRRSRTINGKRTEYGPVEERPKDRVRRAVGQPPLLGAEVSLGQGRRAVILEVHEDVDLGEPTRAIAKAEGHGNSARAVAEYRRLFLEQNDAAWMKARVRERDDAYEAMINAQEADKEAA